MTHLSFLSFSLRLRCAGCEQERPESLMFARPSSAAAVLSFSLATLSCSTEYGSDTRKLNLHRATQLLQYCAMSHQHLLFQTGARVLISVAVRWNWLSSSNWQ